VEFKLAQRRWLCNWLFKWFCLSSKNHWGHESNRTLVIFVVYRERRGCCLLSTDFRHFSWYRLSYTVYVDCLYCHIATVLRWKFHWMC